MPHPYDTHLDHAHTSYFVTEALSELGESGVLAPGPTVLTYLVHYPRWPALRGPGFDRELPLGDLPDTRWSERELTPAELAAKRAALEEYRSQPGVMNGFLRQFLCRNELFATVDPLVLTRIAAVHLGGWGLAAPPHVMFFTFHLTAFTHLEDGPGPQG